MGARAKPAGVATYRLLVSRLIEALVSQVNLLVSRRNDAGIASAVVQPFGFY
jgi:hypothetical protein